MSRSLQGIEEGSMHSGRGEGCVSVQAVKRSVDAVGIGMGQAVVGLSLNKVTQARLGASVFLPLAVREVPHRYSFFFS